MSSTVRQNSTLSRFELAFDGSTAVANYRLTDGIITFTHTEVPYAVRERGIGSQLVKGALDAARAQGLKVVPRCSFVHAYLARQTLSRTSESGH